jgi:NitT/TauT family transport system substrate-binding protein
VRVFALLAPTRAVAGIVLLAALMSSRALALDPVTLQLKWVTQAQFAGYYIAKDKGFYEAEGLDVTIKPGGPDVDPAQAMAGGDTDVVVDWMSDALVARDNSVPLVNIAQPFNKSGLLMICPKDGPVHSEKDFPGKTLGVWFAGNEYPFFAWMHKIGIATDGGPAGVTVLRQGYDIEPLIQGRADCIHVTTYNELGQAIDAGFTLDKLVVFNYTEMGNDLLEDGLYVLEDRLADPAFKDKMARFVRASMRGWDYALAHPDEAAEIVVNNGGEDLHHQTYMMGEVAKLTADSTWVLDIAAYERTAKAVLDQGIIGDAPSGAWTAEIIERAGLK